MDLPGPLQGGIDQLWLSDPMRAGEKDILFGIKGISRISKTANIWKGKSLKYRCLR